MNTTTTLAAYATGLAVVFGAAVGVGNAVGPVGAAGSPDARSGMSGMQMTDGASGPAADEAAGLSVSRDGYTLLLEQAPTAAGPVQPLSFRVLGPDGEAVTRYDAGPSHLVVVRRDLGGAQHLHPAPDAAGRWSLPVTLPDAGTYTVVVDVRPADADDRVVLAADLTLPGTVRTTDLPAEQRTATVGGVIATLTGDLQAGASRPLTLTLLRDGRPVPDLQPFLGARGHLVALRRTDLAYLHTSAQDGEPAGTPGGVTFSVRAPSAGDYRVFVDVQVDGVVRTASFGVRAAAAPPTGAGVTGPDAGNGS